MMNNTKESIHYADEMWISDLPHNFLQTIHHKIEEPCTLQMCLEEMLQKNNNSQLHEQFNPLSANSDQDQFSPNNIHTLSTDKLWELIKWSPKKKCLDLLSNSLDSFFKEMYGDQFGELVCGYWGLKG